MNLYPHLYLLSLLEARICCNSVLYGELHIIFPASEKFNPCPISTTLPSRAVPLSNCPPIPIVFQCGASLTRNIAPESTIVEIDPPLIDILRTSSSSARRAPTSSSYVIIILRHHHLRFDSIDLIRFIRLDSTRLDGSVFHWVFYGCLLAALQGLDQEVVGFYKVGMFKPGKASGVVDLVMEIVIGFQDPLGVADGKYCLLKNGVELLKVG
jgi:hypothetical protein